MATPVGTSELGFARLGEIVLGWVPPLLFETATAFMTLTPGVIKEGPVGADTATATMTLRPSGLISGHVFDTLLDGALVAHYNGDIANEFAATIAGPRPLSAVPTARYAVGYFGRGHPAS